MDAARDRTVRKMSKREFLIMKKFYFTAFIIAFLTIFGISAHAQGWVGDYEFEENGGRTTGGTAIMVSHQLDITEGDKGLVAMIKSAGYQTSIDLVCTAKEENGRLNIYFASYGEDNMFEKYTEGDLLLSLERKRVKGKESLVTHWGKFTPVTKEGVKDGVFFKQTNR
jgi:hypothetical protein